VLVLSSVCFRTFQVWWMMNAKSVANHSRHVVRRLQNSVIHMLSFSFWAPSDLHMPLNEDNDGQCWQQPEHTVLPDKMELLRVDTCRQWYTACTSLVHIQMSSKLPPHKMVDTSKDELLLGGGICHLTAMSQYHAHRKQVPACISNIV